MQAEQDLHSSAVKRTMARPTLCLSAPRQSSHEGVVSKASTQLAQTEAEDTRKELPIRKGVNYN